MEGIEIEVLEEREGRWGVLAMRNEKRNEGNREKKCGQRGRGKVGSKGRPAGNKQVHNASPFRGVDQSQVRKADQVTAHLSPIQPPAHPPPFFHLSKSVHHPSFFLPIYPPPTPLSFTHPSLTHPPSVYHLPICTPSNHLSTRPSSPSICPPLTHLSNVSLIPHHLESQNR